MTLTLYPDLVQGSDEWHAARRGIPTASVMGQLITPNTVKPAANVATRSIVATLVAERINGWVEERYEGYDMMRGHEMEPLARDLYSETYAPVTEMGFMVREHDGIKIGFSPDGLVGDDGMIEVKSRLAKIHLATVIAGDVDREFLAQIQCGLLVSGREWCDFISYCPGMAMWTKRVYPSTTWFNAITEAAEIFETSAVEMQSAYTAAVVGLPMTDRMLNGLEDMVI